MTPEIVLLIVVVLIVVAAVYLNNKQHAAYAAIVKSLTDTVQSVAQKVSAPQTQPSVSHTVNVGGAPVADPSGLSSNDPNFPVELTPSVALALGSVGVQNTHYWAWLKALSPSALGSWVQALCTAGAVADPTVSHATVTFAGAQYQVTNQVQGVLLTLQNVGAISGIS